MKKLLAILLAALMALTGALALAEGDDIQEAPAAPVIPSMTLTAEYDLDREVLANVLTTLGIPEELQGIADTAAALIDEAGERLYFGDEGLEWALTLKGSDILNAVVEAGDESFTLGSNLIPNYVLTLSYDTVGQLIEQLAGQFTEKLGGALEGVDIEAVTEAISGYFEAFIGTCATSVTMGDPEQGEFDVNGTTYNTAVPVNVDLKAIADASRDLAKQLNEDEQVQAALQALQGVGVNVSIKEPPVADEELPVFDMTAYMNIDESGATDGRVEVVFTMNEADADSTAINGDVLVIDSAVTVTLDFARTDDSRLVVAYTPTDDGDQVRVDATTQGMYVGFDMINTVGENGISFVADLYALDAEKPLFTERGEIVMDGALTLSADVEGKTALAVEDLMGENAGEIIQQLTDDLMQNGLGGIVSAALEAMPEEFSALGALFMGGSQAA